MVKSGKLLVKLSVRRRVVMRAASRRCHAGRRRPVRRSAHRRALRRRPRSVLPDTGPTLTGIAHLISRYLKMKEAYERKWNPKPKRWEPLLTADEAQRKLQADLERAYGDRLPSENNPPPPAVPAPVNPPTAHHPPPDAPHIPGPASTPAPLERPKCDVVAVPLVRLPNGFLVCDWSRARPAD